MTLATARRAGQRPTAIAVVDAVAGTGRGATRPAVLPDLAQLAADFLAGHGPVAADVVTDFGDMAFDFELVLFQPGHVEFLTRGAALELSGDVLVVVTDNAGTRLTRLVCVRNRIE